jgi:hypothetical protein
LRMAAASPAMPGVFDVPARCPRSWCPPVMIGAHSMLDDMYSAPTPLGPCIL